PPDLGLGDVDIVGAGEHALAAEEAEAVIGDGQDTTGEDGAAALGLRLQDAADEFRLRHPGDRGVQVELPLREVDEVVAGSLLQLSHVEDGDIRVDVRHRLQRRVSLGWPSSTAAAVAAATPATASRTTPGAAGSIR